MCVVGQKVRPVTCVRGTLSECFALSSPRPVLDPGPVAGVPEPSRRQRRDPAARLERDCRWDLGYDLVNSSALVAVDKGHNVRFVKLRE